MENANVDIRISPALHPDNVKQIDGYDDDTAPLLGTTQGQALRELKE